jgi:exodeoxyribonuclease V alpha subunit
VYNPRDPGDETPTVQLEDGTELRVRSWVMLTKNDHKKGVCNGDTGYVTAIDVTGAVTVLVEGAPDPARAEVPYTRAEARAEIRLAYATTVHKYQGSEAPWCVVVCHSVHKRMLTRRLLYTAITRAKDGVVLVGDRDGIAWAVKNAREVARCTWLKQRIGDVDGAS